MNDINLKIEKAQSIWNNRLHDQMKKNGYSQTKLAKVLQDTYNDSSTQTTIFRWLNIGAKFKGAKGFPKYENMMKLADLLDVDVGFLTGETNGETFTIEKVADFLGLSIEAVTAIRNLTHTQNGISYNIMLSKDYVDTLNSILTSKALIDVLSALEDYKESYELLQTTVPDYFSELKEKYSPKILEIAINLDNIPSLNDDEYEEYRDKHFIDGLPEPTQELCDALADVRYAIEKSYKWEIEQEQHRKETKIYRYELQEATSKLLDSIYPQKKGEKI